MPTYEFRCSFCNYIFNIVYRYDETHKVPICSNCGCDKILRIYDSTPVIFRAKDFYSSSKGK